MSEFSASSTNASESQFEFNLRTRLDALECHESTEDDFLREMLIFRESTPNFASATLAYADERCRQGRLAKDIFLSLKSKIARHELDDRVYGTTIALHADPETSSVATQRVAQSDSVRPGYPAQTVTTDQSTVDQSNRLFGDAHVAAPSAKHLEGAAVRPSPHALEVGCVLLDRYVLEGLLGRGGMGTVFKALDRQRLDLPEGNRHVAVKFLHENIGRRPEHLAELRREFYCAQALSHPNIVKVYEMHHDDDVAFYTMELLEGELLSSVLLRTHPLPLARPHAWIIIRDVGAGLAHAHSRNVVHGDLKPQNVMITDSGEVRILDFGASSTATRRLETSEPLRSNHFRAVTPAYTCCELLDGQQTDPRDDLYALACLSFELLSGKHPFQRLRSTEARDLGMRPLRPLGVTNRQWQTVQLGLSWYRESRSLLVRDWLAKLGLEPIAKRLPPPHALDAMHAPRMNSGAVPPVALLASVIATLGLWMAFSHASFDTKLRGKLLTPKEISSSLDVQQLSVHRMVMSDATILPQLMPIDYIVPPLLPELRPARDAGDAAPSPESGRRESIFGVPQTIGADKITISADAYRVSSGEHFAEINVRRSDESTGSGSFVWWTEASSAKPGNDFVAQNRTTQAFRKGRHLARLFIRIVPNPSRTHTETFYVVIGKPVGGSSLGPITRAAVLIPPLS